MITGIRAKNFKSWKDTGNLRFAPLTGLFGTNSSGKTSIMQMLLMLKQTVESPDRQRVLHTGDQRSLVDLGTFFDLIHGHQSEVPLQLALSWNMPKALNINDPEKKKTQLFSVQELKFETTIREESARVVVESFAYEFNSHRFGMEREHGERRTNKDRYKLVHDGYQTRRKPGRVWPLPAPMKCYGFPDEAKAYYQNTGFLQDFVLAFEDLFSNIAYLGPLREYPQRSYVWAGERPLDVGRKGELAVPALLASGGKSTIARSKGVKKRQTVEERVALWLKEMGLIESFSLKSIAENRKDYEVRVKKTADCAEVLITDVGFGVSQILPVLVLCYYVPEGSVILLEQPEIHLHPGVQSALADVLIDVVNKRKVQIIVESHSEHLLRRLQRRIAESDSRGIKSDDVALYFCRMDGSESVIEQLEMNMFGEITNWPRGFFGDEMEDLIAMTEAKMNWEKVDAGR